jgi:hypothetical protein
MRRRLTELSQIDWWTLVALAVRTSRWSDSRRVIEAMIAGQSIPMATRKDTLDQLLEGAIRKRFSIRTTYSTRRWPNVF